MNLPEIIQLLTSRKIPYALLGTRESGRAIVIEEGARVMALSAPGRRRKYPLESSGQRPMQKPRGVFPSGPRRNRRHPLVERPGKSLHVEGHARPGHVCQLCRATGDGPGRLPTRTDFRIVVAC